MFWCRKIHFNPGSDPASITRTDLCPCRLSPLGQTVRPLAGESGGAPTHSLHLSGWSSIEVASLPHLRVSPRRLVNIIDHFPGVSWGL